MADKYIKREDAVIKAKQAVFAAFRCSKTPTENAVYEHIDIAFKEQYSPSADVAEVVKCKDCIHRPIHMDGKQIDSPYIDDDCCYRDYTCPYLCDDDYYNRMPDDDWFCNHGERMDGGT